MKANIFEFLEKKTKRQSFRRESGPQGPNHPRSTLLNNAKIVTALIQLIQHFDESKRSEKEDEIQIEGMVQGKDNEQ